MELLCKNCGNKDPIKAHEDKCAACHHAVPAPNIRAASTDAEAKALELRLNEAISIASAAGLKETLENFGNTVDGASACICRPLPEIQRLMKNNQLYNTYYDQLRGKSRSPEENEYDLKRLIADNIVFPYYHEQIVFAALTLDGYGPLSYGGHTIVLTNESIAHRASAFDSNTTTFCEKHDLGARKNKVPPGYRTTWEHKGRLAMAKYVSQLRKEMSEEDFSKLLIINRGSTDKDEFIEVHIYGGFSRGAIKAINFGPVTQAYDKAIINSVKKLISTTTSAKAA